MAITNKQAWSAGAGGGGPSPQVVAMPLAFVAGNLLVCCGQVADPTLTMTASDNSGDGGTWATAKLQATSAFLNQKNYIFWKQIGSTPSATNKTVTLTASSGTPDITMYVAEYQAGTVTWALDGTPTSATQDNTTNLPDPGGIVTTSSGPLIIGFASTLATMPTAVTNWTRQITGTVNNNDAVEDRIAVSSGTYDPSWTGTTADWWVALGAAFSATAAGGATEPSHLLLQGVS